MVSLPRLRRKYQIVIYLLPVLAALALLKFAFHALGWEVISLNALFTSIVAATTFLLGFLITGVISDFKESEKIPGELASSLEAIYDEAYSLNKFKRTPLTEEFASFHRDLVDSVIAWFYRKERTRSLMGRLTRMNDLLAGLEPLMPANFIVRLKQEQANVRRLMVRSHTIRETSFIQSGYAVVEVLAFLLICGLLLLQMEPFHESIFVTILVSFMVLYMILLIKDLDNPFGYDDRDVGNEVSLKPLHDLAERIRENEEKP